MKFVGITRFNLVTANTLGSFRATRGRSLAEAKRIVHTTENLNARMRFFEYFCLPTYRMMAEHYDQSHGLILVNADLPAPCLDRLSELVKSVKRLRLVKVSDEASTVRAAANPHIREIAGGDRVFSYRYDDDDALSTIFIPDVMRIAKTIKDNVVISFTHGYALSRLADDAFGLHVRRYPLNAFGLGIISSVAAGLKTVFELGSHTKITLPVHHEEDSLGWLCTVHETNDSRIGKMTSPIFSGEQILREIQKIFPHLSRESLNAMSLRRAADL